jgi:hypothetical protein
MIFVGMSCTKPFYPELLYKRFPMVGVPAICGRVQSQRPFSTVLGMYIPVVAQLADSFVLSKVRAATGRIALNGGVVVPRNF